MRKLFILSFLSALVLGLGIVAVAADDNPASLVTVKSSDKNSGVVTLQIAKESKNLELTCNEGVSSCADLKKGNYKMVELPKNHGMYDCQNVDLYPESASGSEDDQKLGEYCLVTK